MRRGRRAAIGLVAPLIGVLAAGGAARAESLGDALALAYETNPTLQQARAQQRATDEEYVQAESGLRPTVNLNGSASYGNESTGALGPTVTGANFGSASVSVSLSQPLYTSGRVSAKIDAAKADVLAGREGLRRTEISVLQSVIGAYVDVRRDQEQLAISQDNVNVLAQQLAETSARFNAGQLTRTDTAQSQARLALAKSQLSTAQATLGAARAAYDAVVGQNPGDLSAEPPIAQLLPLTIDAAFDAAEAHNPQILQADYAEAASSARLAGAKAQMGPQVGLSATYGYVASNSSLTGVGPGGLGGAASAFSSQTEAVIGANAQMPLFTGGLNRSEVRQAAEQDNVDRIGIESARRQVLQAVAQAWNQLLGARASLAADEEQVKSDQVAFQGVKAEEQVGLRTILDVLNAQQELETSQLTLVGARHDEYVAATAVLAAVGSLEAKDLMPAEPRYDPKSNFDKVRHAPGWVPWEGAVGALDRVGSPTPKAAPPPSPPGDVVKTTDE